MGDYADWIGNTQCAEDTVCPMRVAGLSAALDRDDPSPRDGDPLPPMWHWVLFAPIARRSELGVDGHPARGGFLPPIDLPRRMFAGARYRFHQPLRVGEAVQRRTEIVDITEKQGASGPLVFIKLKHEISGPAGLALEEAHDVVYRDVGAPARAPAKRKAGRIEADWHETFVPDPVLLFRYSALTFNGHRIHYDRTYATEEEGYPGLVVHGPLIAMALTEMLRRKTQDRPLARFQFRAQRALFDLHPFQCTGGPGEDGAGFWLKALDHDGAVAMEAEGLFEA